MNPILLQILQALQQQRQTGQGHDQWGQTNPNHYSGNAIQPSQDYGYSMNLFDPNKGMGQQIMQQQRPQNHQSSI